MSKPTLMSHRKSWDLGPNSSTINLLPSPVKSSISSDASEDHDCDSGRSSESYVESLEHRLQRQEAKCRALARERCQLSTQLQDSVEYIGDLERELLRLQRRDDEAAEEDGSEEDEEKLRPDQRENAQQAQLCSELADENDQLREQIAGLMKELQDLASQKASAFSLFPSASPTTEAACQTHVLLSDATSQAVDCSAEEAAAEVAKLVEKLSRQTDELVQERRVLEERIDSLNRSMLDSAEHYKNLQAAHQSLINDVSRLRDEADGRLAELQEKERTDRVRAVAEAVLNERQHCEHQLETVKAELTSRAAGLETQLSACRELLKWSSGNADRDWQRVKAELKLLRQASEATASRDDLLCQLADREARLLKLEAQISPPTVPPTLPQCQCPQQQQQQQHQTTRHQLSRPLQLLGGLRRKPQIKEAARNELETKVPSGDDLFRTDANAAARLAGRVAETLALMEARICEAQATVRLTGALKVDCESWKRRCRALEAAISGASSETIQRSSRDSSSVTCFAADGAQVQEDSVSIVPDSAQLPGAALPCVQTLPRESSYTSHCLPFSSRNLATTGRCRSVIDSQQRPQQSQQSTSNQQRHHRQQLQEQQQCQGEHIKQSSTRRCFSSLGLNLRRGNGSS